MHQIGLRSKQKERKQNTDKSGSKEESKHKRNVGNSLFNVLRRLERLLQSVDEVVRHLVRTLKFLEKNQIPVFLEQVLTL